MFEYLKQIAQRLRYAADSQVMGGGQQISQTAPPVDAYSLFAAFSEEIGRLDTLDLAAAGRADFVERRAMIRHLVKQNASSPQIYARFAAEILPLIDLYEGEGTGGQLRQFHTITDSAVKQIVERDYRELRTRAFPDGAWKSTVILAGSILEAVLYDRLTRDAATSTQAMNCTQTPKYGKPSSRRPKDITMRSRRHQWTLSNLIDVTCELKFLPPSNEVAIDLVLREYRNFVHPRVEIDKGISITEGHATAAVGMLEVVLDELR
jgi:hypothetical protein